MKFLFLFLCVFAFQNVLSQQIKGKILDQNEQPLSNATIYYDGSTLGTLSTSDGAFNIEFNGQSNLTLVVRYIGFKTVYVPDPDPKVNYEIILLPEENQLDEVVLDASLFSREQMLKAFKRDFLGETKAGKRSQIINEDDIRFYFDKKKKSLFATSRNPIKVINEELGYKIEFDLIDFISKFSSLSLESDDFISNYFGGTSYFEDISENKRRTKRKRLQAYKGSTRHFFKSLTSHRLGLESFKIFHKGFQVHASKIIEIKRVESKTKVSEIFNVESNEENFEVSILENDLDSSKIDKNLSKEKFLKQIAILHKNERSDVSFKTKRFYVDSYGNHTHIDGILFSGEMSKSRLGEMLPINYQPHE